MPLKNIVFFKKPRKEKQSNLSTSYKNIFKIVILGDSSVGKTKFLKKTCYEIFHSNNKNPIGLDFHVKLISFNKHKYKLQIWEVTGEKQFRFLIPLYCKGVNAAILVYDVTNLKSINPISSFVDTIRSIAGNIPLLLLANKVDLKSNRVISTKKGKEYFERFNLSSFLEVSSETGKNVDKVFKKLTENILTFNLG